MPLEDLTLKDCVKKITSACSTESLSSLSKPKCLIIENSSRLGVLCCLVGVQENQLHWT